MSPDKLSVFVQQKQRDISANLAIINIDVVNDLSLAGQGRAYGTSQHTITGCRA